MLPTFIAVLREKPPSFPPALRVKRVQGASGVWEITFAPDGRATFEYGPEVIAGELTSSGAAWAGTAYWLSRSADYSLLTRREDPRAVDSRDAYGARALPISLAALRGNRLGAADHGASVQLTVSHDPGLLHIDS